MTNYPYSAYGPDPHSDINVNADHGWGGYQWPDGVPSSLLATFKVANAGGNSTLTFREELRELVELSCQLGPKNDYDINAYVDGEYWGPWSYENRAISGSSTPSNHSKGKAWDINAPRNPYTSPLVCDMPPGFVADMEAVGWCWGGRYSGDKDAMHWEYGFSPADVAGHVAAVKEILGGFSPTPPDEPTVSIRKKDDTVPIFMQTTPEEGGKVFLVTVDRKVWLNTDEWDLWRRLYPEWADLPGSPFNEVQVNMVYNMIQPGAPGPDS